MSNVDIDELIKEYEDNMGIKLSTRERYIFSYAYTVGKAGLDEEDKYTINVDLKEDD